MVGSPCWGGAAPEAYDIFGGITDRGPLAAEVRFVNGALDTPSEASGTDEGSAGLQEEAEGGQTAAWWCLWCHERVHKEEALPLRRAVGRAVAEHGGILKCVRKAKQFGGWATRGRARIAPHVLLTDWREVKPCLHLISQLPAHLRPALILVITPHVQRAEAWARTVDAEGGSPPIKVRETFDHAALLLVASAMAATTQAGQAGICRHQPPLLSSRPCILGQAPAFDMANDTPVELALAGLLPPPRLHTAAPLAFLGAARHALTPAVAELLVQLCPLVDEKEKVAQMLEQAVPPCYYD